MLTAEAALSGLAIRLGKHESRHDRDSLTRGSIGLETGSLQSHVPEGAYEEDTKTRLSATNLRPGILSASRQHSLITALTSTSLANDLPLGNHYAKPAETPKAISIMRRGVPSATVALWKPNGSSTNPNPASPSRVTAFSAPYTFSTSSTGCPTNGVI